MSFSASLSLYTAIVTVIIVTMNASAFISSPSSPRAKSFPVSAYLRIKREPQEVEDTCISWRFSQGICRADNQKHIITYIKETHRKSLVHNREGKCLVRSSLHHNLERGGDEPKLKGCKPETNLLERQSKRDLVPMRSCAKPWANN